MGLMWRSSRLAAGTRNIESGGRLAALAGWLQRYPSAAGALLMLAARALTGAAAI